MNAIATLIRQIVIGFGRSLYCLSSVPWLTSAAVPPCKSLNFASPLPPTTSNLPHPPHPPHLPYLPHPPDQSILEKIDRWERL